VLGNIAGVAPAQAGAQFCSVEKLGPGLRRDDALKTFLPRNSALLRIIANQVSRGVSTCRDPRVIAAIAGIHRGTLKDTGSPLSRG
jgi:hypothetical protein